MKFGNKAKQEKAEKTKPPKKTKEKKEKAKATKADSNSKKSEKKGITFGSKKKGPKVPRIKPMPVKSKIADPLLALDIGSKSLKVVIGQYKKGRIYVKNAFEYGVSSSKGDDGGKILNKTEVARTLSNMLREHGIKGTSLAVCTIQNAEVVQRELLVPFLKDKEMESMLTYEMGQHLPIDISAYAIQYKILGEEDGKARVMACALPKATAKEYLEMLTETGVKPIAMDVNTNALGKLLKAEAAITKTPVDRNLMLIDMGHSRFNISFFSAGECRFNRISDIGCTNIDELIYRNLEVMPKDVETIKREKLSRISMSELFEAYGSISDDYVSHDPGETILRETVDVIDSWASTIENVMEYYIAREGKYSVDEILLYGGSSYIKDIDKFFEKRLNIPTNRVTRLESVVLDASLSEEIIPEYLNVFGALIRV